MSRGRVSRAERALNLAGPLTVCPTCSGERLKHRPFGPWSSWLTGERIARVIAEHDGREYVQTAPEPDEPLEPCWTCSGAGELDAAQLARHESGRREGAARLEQMMAGLRRFGEDLDRQRAAAAADVAPAGLRSVPDDLAI